MGVYAIFVEFSIQPGKERIFEELVVENAKASRREEPGCFVFDVLRKAGSDNTFILYEVYENKTSFETHKSTGHFARFTEAVDSIVEDKRVTEMNILHASYIRSI